MFKLEITKLDSTIENIYNMNLKEDDFLQFMPKQYGVTSAEVKAFLMLDSDKDQLEAYLRLNSSYELDLSTSGSIKVIEVGKSVDPATGAEIINATLIKEYIGTSIKWPYDNTGKFLGNGYEL